MKLIPPSLIPIPYYVRFNKGVDLLFKSALFNDPSSKKDGRINTHVARLFKINLANAMTGR
jgi:hypothetical protein